MSGNIRSKSETALDPKNDIPIKGSEFRRDQFRKVDDTESFYVSPHITDEELGHWRDQMKLFEGKGADKPIARYKLEIQFGVDHHVNGSLTYGVITVWENGSHFNGGADALLYACPGKFRKYNECEAIIPDDVNGKSPVICPTCMTAWPSKALIGQTYYRLPLQKWAYVVHKWFMRLNLDADVRIKYNYVDIRKANAEEEEKKLRGEILNKSRDRLRRKARVYPLEYIIRDVNAGADLEKRFLSFLKD